MSIQWSDYFASEIAILKLCAICELVSSEIKIFTRSMWQLIHERKLCATTMTKLRNANRVSSLQYSTGKVLEQIHVKRRTVGCFVSVQLIIFISLLTFHYLKLHDFRLDIYRPQTKLRKGNVFTPVCQSFCSQGGVCPSVCWDTLPPTSHPPPADGYCCGRYASYWNAFLFRVNVVWKSFLMVLNGSLLNDTI